VTKKRLAVIGNGMAAERFLEEMVRRQGLTRYTVSVFAEETGGSYNRILLGKVLAGQSPDSIVTKPMPWYAKHGVALHAGVTVKRLDTDAGEVETTDGQRHPYDLAVIATGSQPLVPPIEGLTAESGDLRPGAFLYRSMSDCLSIRAHARAGDNAVVLGGGLLGLEAAKELSDLGLHVTVVHARRLLMNAQLDDLGGAMLQRHVEKRGIFVRTGHTIEAVVGQGPITALRLDDGKKITADLLVLACGVRPRVEVAKASGLPINKGILVNDALATEVPGIYAIGNCAEHNGKTYGLAAPAWEQAGVLADLLTGSNPQARYHGSKIYTRLKVAGVDVASMGRIEPELEMDEVIQVVETRRDTYRRLIVRGGELIGAILVGNTSATARLIQLFDRGDPLPADPLLALCSESSLVDSAGDRQVCNCRKVTESRLRVAIAEGATTVESLSDATGAGTGCGSCKGELAELVSRHAAKPAQLGTTEISN
jgi:nitrite reductase (NADH) large subunit